MRFLLGCVGTVHGVGWKKGSDVDCLEGLMKTEQRSFLKDFILKSF